MPHNVICGTSLKTQGNMDFRFGTTEEVIENRTRFLAQFGIAYEDHIAMRCDHTDIITSVFKFHPAVGARSQEDQIHSEVLVTQEKNLALMLFTADCQATSFFDPVTQTIALAHISRKTLTNKLSEQTVEFLKEEHCVEVDNLIVTIGPSIQKVSYAFPVPLEDEHPLLAPFTEVKNGFAYIDLPKAHTQQLLELGIKKENITIATDDTASSSYFSYYKAKREGAEDHGRMANILMLR